MGNSKPHELKRLPMRVDYLIHLHFVRPFELTLVADENRRDFIPPDSGVQWSILPFSVSVFSLSALPKSPFCPASRYPLQTKRSSILLKCDT